MGFGSKPSAPEPQPPTVTYEDVKTDDDIVARDKNKKRLAGAMNSKKSILTQDGGSGGKTLLGQ